MAVLVLFIFLTQRPVPPVCDNIIFQDEKEKLEDEILLLEKDIKTCTEEIREVETQIQQHENSRRCHQRKTKNFVNSVLKVRTRLPFF